jgi:hypothetical protein
MATLLYALTEEELLLQKLQEQITQKDINRIQTIANTIHTKPVKQFLVEGIDGDYYILKALTDSNIIVNSTGTDIKT